MKNHTAKFEAENCLKLSIFWLNNQNPIKHGCIIPINWSCSGDILLSALACFIINKNENNLYLFCSTSPKYGYGISLTSTICNYGNKRWWFLCPVKNCRKRVGVLYKTPIYNFFVCRHHNLTYKSSKLSGRYKRLGKYLLISELRELEATLKKRFYRDDFTKRYKKFCKRQDQTFSAMEEKVKWAKDFVLKHKKEALKNINR